MAQIKNEQYASGDVLSVKAGETISRGMAVFFNSSANDYDVADTASSATLTSVNFVEAIALEDALDGETFEVMAGHGKQVKALAGDNVAIGALLMVESGGRVVTFSGTAGQYTMLVGRALEAGADGDLISIRFAPQLVLTETA